MAQRSASFLTGRNSAAIIDIETGFAALGAPPGPHYVNVKFIGIGDKKNFAEFYKCQFSKVYTFDFSGDEKIFVLRSGAQHGIYM